MEVIEETYKKIKSDLIDLMTKKLTETDTSDHKKWLYVNSCIALYKCYRIYLNPQKIEEGHVYIPEYSRKDFDDFKDYVGYQI